MAISDDAKAVVAALAKLKLVEPPVLEGEAEEALREFIQITKDLATKPHMK